MSSVGNVRIGHKAPFFQCEAVVKGVIQEVTLNTYIRPSIKPDETDSTAPWLIILFIPAAFSFVCPTEVLAFQNCHDEFKDRNCSIVFVSVDTKHSLWHWQNVPRQYGGLGQVDIPLLSDVNHRIAQDYGVLIEEEGVSLRGMFIVDNEGIVQQITLNNLTVGRSVLEALRLLEAFQAVAKHGVLCPVDWKPSGNASDTISTISNMLTESYDERLANLQAEFGDVQVTDLDAKHSLEDSRSRTPTANTDSSSPDAPQHKDDDGSGRARSRSNPEPLVMQEFSQCRPIGITPSHSRTDCLPRLPSASSASTSRSVSESNVLSSPETTTAVVTPLPTPVSPSISEPPKSTPSMARHARGTRRSSVDHRTLSHLFIQCPPTRSLFPTLMHHTSFSTDSSSGHSSAPPTPLTVTSANPPSITTATADDTTMTTPTDSEANGNAKSNTKAALPPKSGAAHLNTYESRRGSTVILEFADPTSNSQSRRPGTFHSKSTPLDLRHAPSTYTRQYMAVPPIRSASRARAPSLARASSWTGPPPSALGYLNCSSPRGRRSGDVSAAGSPASSAVSTPGPTRLQATFEAIRKMGSGLASPAPKKGMDYFGVGGVEA